MKREKRHPVAEAPAPSSAKSASESKPSALHNALGYGSMLFLGAAAVAAFMTGVFFSPGFGRSLRQAGVAFAGSKITGPKAEMPYTTEASGRAQTSLRSLPATGKR